MLLEEDVARQLIFDFLFGVPSKVHKPDLFRAEWWGLGPDSDHEQVLSLVIKREDLFRFRKDLLKITKGKKELKEFREFWKNHLKFLEGVDDGKNDKDVG